MPRAGGALRENGSIGNGTQERSEKVE